MIRVLLAEDQVMFRTAVRGLLQLEEDIDVVGEVGRGDELVTAALVTRPDVAVVDIEMPVRGSRIARGAAELQDFDLDDVWTTWLRTQSDPGRVAGFVLKDAPIEELAEAIRRCAAGENVVAPELASRALRAGVSPLSSREQEILGACADGRRTRTPSSRALKRRV